MKISRGYKFKLDPTDAQAEAFAKNVGICRVVYNLAELRRMDPKHPRKIPVADD